MAQKMMLPQIKLSTNYRRLFKKHSSVKTITTTMHQAVDYYSRPHSPYPFSKISLADLPKSWKNEGTLFAMVLL